MDVDWYRHMTSMGGNMCEVDGWPEFYGTREHVARKEHTCGECQRIIRVGEKYEVSYFKWQYDKPTSFKTCSQCQEDWDEVERLLEEAGADNDHRCLGELCEYIGEAIDLGLIQPGQPLAVRWTWFSEPMEDSEFINMDPNQLELAMP